MKKEKKINFGRPTTYDKKYCQSIVDFFDRDLTVQIKAGLDLAGRQLYKTVANELPLFSSFATSIGVTRDTVNEWVKVHEEFSVAHKMAAQLQERMLISNTMKGYYQQPSGIFAMKNLLRWTDRTEVTETKFIFDFVGKISDILNRTVPDFCPHCKKLLTLRENTIKQLEELSHKLEVGTKRQSDGS
jgi:hypothetical protein